MAVIESLLGKLIRVEQEPRLDSIRRFRTDYDTAHREWDQVRLEARSVGDGEPSPELEARIEATDANYRRVRELERRGTLPTRIGIVLFDRKRITREIHKRQ